MPNRLFSRTPLHEHPEAAQRVLGAAQLAPDSSDLLRLLREDPAPEVRAAAAARCADLAGLAAAWQGEADEAVRVAISQALGSLLATTADAAAAREFLATPACDDALRAQVARQAADAERRLAAIACLRDEALLVELALAAGHAETRLAAAECVRSPERLRALAEAARNKDRGVARLAKQRLEALENREGQASEADAIVAQLEALAGTPGPILTAVVELNRRWQALDMRHDAARLERCEAARRALQARFEREQAEQLARAKFERRVSDWVGGLATPDGPEALAGLRAELAALRDEAGSLADATALARLAEAEVRLEVWARELEALAGAEALVVEAERLAADTSVDNAQLPERWQALDRAIRTPALSRRFEAALMVIEQRRLAQAQAAREEASAARARVHALLHAAEQALAAGHLHEARAAVDEMKAIKAEAGSLPKPTQQRMGRVGQQLGELERWESFGQQTARRQLCERAEALLAPPGLDPARTAAEVRKLREEWKALDQQHAGVPRSLWERFDGACEKAYAPAARHFAELAAQRKLARQQREAFIETAAAHVPTLLAGTPEPRAIERWLRETDRGWREGGLGSVDPGTWKKLDGRLKEALAPLRATLGSAREEAKSGRLALIAEVEALALRALEREAPSLVKAVQARWQEHAKAHPLQQRDERGLWERFRAACDAVFEARNAKRQEEVGRKQEGRRALDEVCGELERLAKAGEREENAVRADFRALQDRWRALARGADPALKAVEGRFRSAARAVEGALAARARAREAAVWRTLAEKDRLCEEIESAVLTGSALATDALAEQWTALPELGGAWEKRMVARRDAALAAAADASLASRYRERIEKGTAARREGLLELEMTLGLESPADLQPQRLALQVRMLKERFGGAAASAASTGERVLAWCAGPAVLAGADRERRSRVFAAMGRAP